MQQPTIFSATTLSALGSYGDECQACSSRVLQPSNSVEIFSIVSSEREQESTSDNKIFRMPLCTEKQARAAVYILTRNTRVELRKYQCMLVNQLSSIFHNGEG